MHMKRGRLDERGHRYDVKRDAPYLYMLLCPFQFKPENYLQDARFD